MCAQINVVEYYKNLILLVGIVLPSTKAENAVFVSFSRKLNRLRELTRSTKNSLFSSLEGSSIPCK